MRTFWEFVKYLIDTHYFPGYKSELLTELPIRIVPRSGYCNPDYKESDMSSAVLAYRSPDGKLYESSSEAERKGRIFYKEQRDKKIEECFSDCMPGHNPYYNGYPHDRSHEVIANQKGRWEEIRNRLNLIYLEYKDKC